MQHHQGWKLYQERGAEALWDRCLGFMRWDMEQTMAMQRSRLEAQLKLLNNSEIGRQFFRGAAPTTVEEFREAAPLTDYYEDYLDTLGQKREDILPAPAKAWTRTSGRSKDQPKWVPNTQALMDEGEWHWLAIALAGTASRWNEVAIKKGTRLFNMTAPPPYASGTLSYTMENIWPFEMIPPGTPEVHGMPFEERTAYAFGQAVDRGFDIVLSQASIMSSIGEGFATRKPPGSVLSRLKRPRAVARMARAAMRAKAAGRGLYPRDAWTVQGALCGGMDSSLFRERIKEYWGVYPLDLLASTEAAMVAMQNWDRTSMTLVPTLNFFEFVPDDQLEIEREQPGYQPGTVLMDGLEAGRQYEVVITNFFGGALMRYRTGDILRVTSIGNPTTGAVMPQVIHFARRTDLLEVAGFVTMNEQTVWTAIEEAAVPYEDWTIRKEIDGTDPVLHLRIELKPGATMTSEAVRERLHRGLAQVNSDWKDMEEMAGMTPLRVTLLPAGSFQRYRDRRIAEGADLGQLKPQHMNPTDEAIAKLLNAAQTAETLEPARMS